MTENKQNNNDRTDRRPDCVTEIRMGNTVLVVSGFFQERYHSHRSRQDDESAGSGNRSYTQAKLYCMTSLIPKNRHNDGR